MQRAAFERAMAPAKKLLDAAGLQCTQAQLTGNQPGDVIAAYATKRKLDVLVLGSRGMGGLGSALLGSVATRVTSKCRNALLFIQGWRVSEVLGLAWGDLDLDAAVAEVRRACSYADGVGMVLGPPKTEGVIGRHHLTPIVAELLRRRRSPRRPRQPGYQRRLRPPPRN